MSRHLNLRLLTWPHPTFEARSEVADAWVGALRRCDADAISDGWEALTGWGFEGGGRSVAEAREELEAAAKELAHSRGLLMFGGVPCPTVLAAGADENLAAALEEAGVLDACAWQLTTLTLTDSSSDPDAVLLFAVRPDVDITEALAQVATTHFGDVADLDYGELLGKTDRDDLIRCGLVPVTVEDGGEVGYFDRVLAT